MRNERESLHIDQIGHWKGRMPVVLENLTKYLRRAFKYFTAFHLWITSVFPTVQTNHHCGCLLFSGITSWSSVNNKGSWWSFPVNKPSCWHLALWTSLTSNKLLGELGEQFPNPALITLLFTSFKSAFVVALLLHIWISNKQKPETYDNRSGTNYMYSNDLQTSCKIGKKHRLCFLVTYYWAL